MKNFSLTLKFVKAEPGPKNSVIYIDEDGNHVMYFGGHRNWRNNNPGNLRTGAVSRRNGQIGTAGGFAVFPDAETGRRALKDSLQNVHSNKSLEQMIRVYAPKSENDTAGYLKFLKKKTGVKNNKKIKDFTAGEFQKLIEAIEAREGGAQGVGTIYVLPLKRKIVGVLKDKKGLIYKYQVPEFGWLSKSKAIDLTRDGQIDAVIVISSTGYIYLRSRPDSLSENNLESLLKDAPIVG